MNDTKLILWVLITFGIILAVACVSSSSEVAPASPLVGATLYIPTVFELQQSLCEAGYSVEIDGEVGDETKKMWDSYCHDRFAAKFINPENK